MKGSRRRRSAKLARIAEKQRRNAMPGEAKVEGVVEERRRSVGES